MIHFSKAALGLALGLCLAPGETLAQEITTLIQFTNVWKYDQSGRELGTAWRTNTFIEVGWSSGLGLLGWEPDTPGNYTVHSPINTPLVISSTVTTFYFRTTFSFFGLANGLNLIATNLVDDGCMIYLNGRPVGGVRAPASFDATTTFSGAPEGQLDVVTFTNLPALRQGNNLLAAEVHQSANTSADVMWGMKLMAIRDLPLAITHQPQSQSVIEGNAVTFSIGVSGGPAFYGWQKDGVMLPGATNANFMLSSPQLSSSGEYRVVVTNSISAVTSSVATLTVLTDREGPRLMAAIGNNTPTGGAAYPTNTINVFFSEPVEAASTRNTNNYILTQLGTTNTVPILSILYSSALGALLTVDSSNAHWVPGGDYVLMVSGVKDPRGNVIAPDSQIAVSWPQTTNLIRSNHSWSFHNSWIFDPDVIATNWYACDFVEGPWWGSGIGPFCGGVFGPPPSACVGCQTQIGFQPEPALFRTWFNWPANFPTAGVMLRPRFVVDDGAVFYLNGIEIYRYNMPGGPVIATTKAAAIVGTTPPCVTNLSLIVSNLVPGSNCLAVAVVQGNSPVDADIVFHLELDARYALSPNLPPEVEPVLVARQLAANELRLSWVGHGYALETTTNFNLGATSYPLGPWQPVTNMSNPYTNRLDETQRFFRLTK